ncbi:recombinase family protein (plasmid) [Halobacillus litoralis]|uniref:recombinase family protein n=1 Tax=Halobacillus litoralis TaxID=45668 RepID=UPI001CFEC649|nr:recombinase family protein [Halobacillus litoralis]WLR49602.1 recombinase family protein [Halobacillus litoralis]
MAVNWKELNKKQVAEDELTKVCGYVRVSTYDQIKGVSLEDQAESIRNWAKYMGYELVHIYKDAGESGASKERPAFQQMMKDAEQGMFDMVCCAKIDRFARSIRYGIEYMYHLEDLNVYMKFLSPEIDTRKPEGKMLFTMMSQFAEMEKEQIQERMDMGKFNKLSSGKFISKKPFGYDVVDGDLILNEEESFWVEKIFKMSAYGEMSYRKIAEELNAQSAPLPTARSKQWTHNTVYKIIKNDLYKGFYYYKGQLVEMEFEPIVSKSIWSRANKQRERV